MMQAVKLVISGKVQKVGYRNWFAVQAVELELKGYVQNLPTAPVEAVVVGDERKIQEMIIRSQKGPIYADVANIQQFELNPAEYQFENFQIKSSFND
ncbi:acylphosphatase [Acinetobacter schindleri]|uniref:acylphosphatase n=1 Tax=Acinetobacter schindleri TaxID=108981 RepID=UPI0030AA990A